MAERVEGPGRRGGEHAATAAATTAPRSRAGKPKASARAHAAHTPVTSGTAQLTESTLETTTISVIAPAAIASAPTRRPAREPDSAIPTPAPTSSAIQGARNDT